MNESPKYSDSLIIVKGAKDLRYSKYEGTDQVIYDVVVQYPATQVLNEISKKLEAKDWKPLKEDYLNPGLLSSHVEGWTDFIDGTTKPRKKVHQWLAQWENKNRDIMWVALRYSYPEGSKANLKSLTVYMSFMPSELAIEAKEQVLEYISENKDK